MYGDNASYPPTPFKPMSGCELNIPHVGKSPAAAFVSAMKITGVSPHRSETPFTKTLEPNKMEVPSELGTQMVGSSCVVHMYLIMDQGLGSDVASPFKSQSVSFERA